MLITIVGSATTLSVLLIMPSLLNRRLGPSILVQSSSLSDSEAFDEQTIFTNQPPRAQLFVDKQLGQGAAVHPSSTPLAQMIHANPLLATLNMFSSPDNNATVETLDNNITPKTTTTAPMTANNASSSFFPAFHNKLYYKKIRPPPPTMASLTPTSAMAQQLKKASSAPTMALASLLVPSNGANVSASKQQQQMDNFDMLYQLFNASMFHLAESQQQVGDVSISQRSSKTLQSNEWSNNQLEEAGANLPEPASSKGQQQNDAASGVAKQHQLEEKLAEEEDRTTMPFEVTDALTMALSSPVPVSEDGTMQQEVLQEQEQFPMEQLRQQQQQPLLKYPWERQRGEQQQHQLQHNSRMPSSSSVSSATALPSSSSSLLFPTVVPGASFYVDQHVSRGTFGRELSSDATPTLVYDPNVLQSRYGFSGLLYPAPYDDNRLVRGQKQWWSGARPRGGHPHAYHWPIVPVGLAASSPPVETATVPTAIADPAVFLIPPMPRLSVARAVPPPAAQPQAAPVSPLKLQHQMLGFWPSASNISSSRSQEERHHQPQHQQQKIVSLEPPAATTAEKVVVPSDNDGIMVPLGGNHLQWVPARVAAKGVPTSAAASKETDDTFNSSDQSGGDANKRWPCLADPIDLVLADTPPAVGQPIAVCFRRVRQCLMRWAPAPLQRRVGQSRVECIQSCVGHGQCSALTYAHPSSTCELFHARNGTGTAQLFHHREFDYLESKVGHGKPLRNCWDDFLPNDGPSAAAAGDDNPSPSEFGDELHAAPQQHSNSEKKGGTPLHCNRTTVPYPFYRTTPTTPTPVVTVADTFAASTAPMTTITTPAAASRERCSSPDRDIVLFQSKGYRLANPHVPMAANRPRQTVGGESPPVPLALSTNVLTQQHSSETACSFSCLVNVANGKRPFECLAATFDSVLAQCALHGIGSSADGSIQLVPDPTFSHYEKGCILTEIVELCQSQPIIRFPQKTLLGFAIGSRRAASLLDCLELCLAHNNLNHNHATHRMPASASLSSSSSSSTASTRCHSVVFFYEESAIVAAEVKNGADYAEPVVDGQNCVLNSESRDSAPTFFMDETEALVDYASFDHCYQMMGRDHRGDDDADAVQRRTAVASKGGGEGGGEERRATAAIGEERRSVAAIGGGGEERRATAAIGEERRSVAAIGGGGEERRAASEDELLQKQQQKITQAQQATVTVSNRKTMLPNVRKLRPLTELQEKLRHIDGKRAGTMGLGWRRRIGGQPILLTNDQKMPPIRDGQFSASIINNRQNADSVWVSSGTNNHNHQQEQHNYDKQQFPTAQHQQLARHQNGSQHQIVTELSAVYSVRQRGEEEENGRPKVEAGRRRHKQQQQITRVDGQTRIGQLRWRRRRRRRRRR